MEPFLNLDVPFPRSEYGQSQPLGPQDTPSFGGAVTFSTVARPVNGITFGSVATGNTPFISATGSDSNIGLTVQSKGNGSATLSNALGGGNQSSVACNSSGNVVVTCGSSITATFQATLNQILFNAPLATNNNSGIPLKTVGNSSSQTGSLLQMFQSSGGNLLYDFKTVANAVNGIVCQAAATGSPVSISAGGSSANPNAALMIFGNPSNTLNTLLCFQ